MRARPSITASFLRRYRAAIDWPACEFYRELMAACPDAKVVLTVRDPERWYDSVAETLWAIGRTFPWWFPPAIARMQDAIIWNGRFQGRFADRAAAISAFRAHVDEVKRTRAARATAGLRCRRGLGAAVRVPWSASAGATLPEAE